MCLESRHVAHRYAVPFSVLGDKAAAVCEMTRNLTLHAASPSSPSGPPAQAPVPASTLVTTPVLSLARYQPPASAAAPAPTGGAFQRQTRHRQTFHGMAGKTSPVRRPHCSRPARATSSRAGPHRPRHGHQGLRGRRRHHSAQHRLRIADAALGRAQPARQLPRQDHQIHTPVNSMHVDVTLLNKAVDRCFSCSCFCEVSFDS